MNAINGVCEYRVRNVIALNEYRRTELVKYAWVKEEIETAIKFIYLSRFSIKNEGNVTIANTSSIFMLNTFDRTL